MSERNVKRSPAVRDIRYTPPPRKSFYARHKVKILIAALALLAVMYITVRIQSESWNDGIEPYLNSLHEEGTLLAR